MLNDDFYEYDEKGLNGFDRWVLERVDSFLETILSQAKVFGLDETAVFTLAQARTVVRQFMEVDYDGQVRVTSVMEDGYGTRLSVLDLSPERIIFGVAGQDEDEEGGEPYEDIYFVVGEAMESDSLQDDWEVWESEFLDKLIRPSGKLEVEGEITDIREGSFKVTRPDEEDDESEEDEENGLIPGWD